MNKYEKSSNERRTDDLNLLQLTKHKLTHKFQEEYDDDLVLVLYFYFDDDSTCVCLFSQQIKQLK